LGLARPKAKKNLDRVYFEVYISCRPYSISILLARLFVAVRFSLKSPEKISKDSLIRQNFK